MNTETVVYDNKTDHPNFTGGVYRSDYFAFSPEGTRILIGSNQCSVPSPFRIGNRAGIPTILGEWWWLFGGEYPSHL